jgi:Domain of unknown function (DUF4375)
VARLTELKPSAAGFPRIISIVAETQAVLLTRAQLDAATDDDLLNLVHDHLMALRRPHLDDDSHVRTLPRGLQLLWAMEMVDADIIKDGLQSVFETSTVHWIPDAVEAFQRIGFLGHAAVLERAVQTIFGQPLGQADLQAVNEMTDEAFEALECLGDEYNDQPAFADELTTFIRKNPELYVVS